MLFLQHLHSHILKTISPIGTGVRYCLHVASYLFSLVSWSPLLILLSFCAVRCCAVLSHFSRVRFFATLKTVAHQDPLSMGFSRKEYWNGLPCSSPTDLPDLGIEPLSLMSPALAGGFFTTRATWEALLSFQPSVTSRLPSHMLSHSATLGACSSPQLGSLPNYSCSLAPA